MFRALRILYRLYKLRWLIEESELVRYERVHIPDKKAFYSVYCRYLFTENGVYPLYDSSSRIGEFKDWFYSFSERWWEFRHKLVRFVAYLCKISFKEKFLSTKPTPFKERIKS
mgnify:FL=1